MIEEPIYLDCNATTPVLPEVVDAMLPFLREHFGNPSRAHPVGRIARAAVENARRQVAALLWCDADEVVFTSGGTESNNLAIRGVNPWGRCRSTSVSWASTFSPSRDTSCTRPKASVRST